MQLNKQTDYALRVLIYLAIMENKQLVTVDEFVQKFNIARNHLTKIVSKLARLRYIVTYRGTRGGMRINPRTYDLYLDQIISQFEPSFNVINCSKMSCPMSGLCEFKSVLDKASDQFVKVLRQYKLSDVVPWDKESIDKINFRLTKQ